MSIRTTTKCVVTSMATHWPCHLRKTATLSVNESNRVSVSVNGADDAHPPGCSGHEYPSLSQGAAQSKARPPPPFQTSYISPHPEHASLVTSTPASEQPAPQLVMDPAIQMQNQVPYPPLFAGLPTNGVHRYILMSHWHGSDYALVEVLSRGSATKILCYISEKN
ncbi:hypothetical protein BJV78DRAFT_1180291 [Lactifluus subvellereus]|nr:hypothetical protein BJV78DRAFT_1180291 [Lactifluus subvellereus]